MRVEIKQVKEYVLHLSEAEAEALYIKAMCQNPYMHTSHDVIGMINTEPSSERSIRERIFNSIV